MTTPAPALPSSEHHAQQNQAQSEHAAQHTEPVKTDAQHQPPQHSSTPHAAMIGSQPPAVTHPHKRIHMSPHDTPQTPLATSANVEHGASTTQEPAAKKMRVDDDASAARKATPTPTAAESEEEHMEEAVQQEGTISTSAPVASPNAAEAASAEPMAPSLTSEQDEKAAAMDVDSSPHATLPSSSFDARPVASTTAAVSEERQAPATPSPSSTTTSLLGADVSGTMPHASGRTSAAMGTYADCVIYVPPEMGVSAPSSKDDDLLVKEQLKFCVAALKQMKKHKPTIDAFLQPVDPVSMGIPQYPQFVKEPMDVSTIERQLQHGAYRTAQGFVNDVYRMLNNAILFNRPDHFVHVNALKLKSWFDGYMSRLPIVHSARATATPKASSKLADIDTRPKRDVHPPKEMLPGSVSSPVTAVATPTAAAKKAVSEPARQREGLKFAAQVLKEIMKPKYININAIFLEPVDPIALNIPEYWNVIKQPMDLSTIKRKLEHSQYSSADDFEADVRLMIDNCLTFNHPNDPVHTMGLEFERVFNNQMSYRPDAEQQDAHLSTVDQEEESRVKIEIELVETNIAELQARLQPLREKLAALQRKRRPSSVPGTGKKTGGSKSGNPLATAAVQKTPKHHATAHAHAKSTTKKASHTTPHYANHATRQAPATVSHHGGSSHPLSHGYNAGESSTKKGGNSGRVKPLTLDQKQMLSEAVSLMDETKLARVVEMIKESMPSLFGASEEIELDIESIDDQTQRNLYNFAVRGTALAKRKAQTMNPAASRVEQLSGAIPQERKQERSHYSSGSEDEDEIDD